MRKSSPAKTWPQNLSIPTIDSAGGTETRRKKTTGRRFVVFAAAEGVAAAPIAVLMMMSAEVTDETVMASPIWSVASVGRGGRCAAGRKVCPGPRRRRKGRFAGRRDGEAVAGCR